jgi:hypothetical protein
VKAKLLRRQKSTSEIENRIEQEEESEYLPETVISIFSDKSQKKAFLFQGMEWFLSSFYPRFHELLN